MCASKFVNVIGDLYVPSISDWHRCCACNKTPKYNCFCCPFAVCKGCRSDVEFAIIRKEKGFCEECLELAWLIEEKRDVDSSGVLNIIV